MCIRTCVMIFVLHYTLVWVNKISPCLGEVFTSGSVSVDGDTAILTLTASVNGTFQCKLDDGSFHTCYSGDTYDNLTAGWHSVEVVFTPDGLSQVILLPSSLKFNILPAIDCGRPTIPSDVFGIYINTTVNSTVTYFCTSSLAPCATDTCLPNGTWTRSVHNCIRAVVSMAQTAYSVNESDRFANITVLLDQPSCITAMVTTIPRITSPGDAAKNDFDTTPIVFEIAPGNTNTVVSIPITNNVRVENDEAFEVILQSNDDDVIVGSPNQTTVTILNDDAIRVSFERPTYTIRNRRVRVCLTKAGKHDFPITVLIQQLNPEGFAVSNSSLRFNSRRSRVCYRQAAIGDSNTTSFNVTIVPSKHLRIDTHGSTRIVMRCEVPGEPINGQRYFQSTTIGSTVTYSCDDGLKLVEGSQSRDCLDTGLWSGSVPVCKSIDCSVEGQLYLPCYGNGTDCGWTCADYDPLGICFLCVPNCRCPGETVLDEIANRCVNINECSKNR